MSIEDWDDNEDLEINEDVEETEDDAGEVADVEAGVVEGEEGAEVSVEGTELAEFEAADIEEREEVSDAQLISVLESILFSTDKPQSVAVLKQAFKNTNVNSARIRKALEELQAQYADFQRGVSLEETAGGYQLRTKVDNAIFLRRMVKARTFKLSGPALEVLSIVAYKQPITKAEVDEIRGVESGHLVRGLMERALVHFEGKSDLPGKPMLYGTTKKFLEIFGLRNLKELPSLSEIDQLLPDGIDETDEKEEKLSDLTGVLSQHVGTGSYSEGEEELLNITDQLQQITTSTEFFEKEKERMRAEREELKAKDIQEAIEVGEIVSERDRRWLDRYRQSLQPKVAEAVAETQAPTETSSAVEATPVDKEDSKEQPSVSSLAAAAAKSLFDDQGSANNDEGV